MATKHNCHLQGKLGEQVFICSRCGGCYVCRHKAVHFYQEDVWMWRCKDGKFRPAIFDGKTNGMLNPIFQEQRPEHSCKTNKCMMSEDEFKALSFLGASPDTQ